MDWKKEVKLSDLFKRGEKAQEPAEPKEEKPREEKPARERTMLSFRRGPKEAKPAEETTPREEKPARERTKLSFRRGPKEEKPREEKPARERTKLSFRRGPKDAKPAEDAKARREAKRSKKRGKAVGVVTGVPLMRALNLLPKDDPRQASKRPASTAQLVLPVVAVVAFASLASYFLILNARVSAKEHTKDELRTELAALDLPSSEPKPEEQEVDPKLGEELDKRTAALKTALGARVAWDRLLREFSLVLPEDVWLKSLTATGAAKPADPAAPPQPGAVAPMSTFNITGYTHDQEGVARLLARLSVLPELSSVSLLSSTSTMIGKREVVEFTISAVVKTAGAPA